MSKDTCFTDEKHEAGDDPFPYPLSFPLHRVYIQNVSCVCRHLAHMLKTHVRVVPAYTGVFSVSHTTHPTHHNPPQPPHHTETDTERDRDKERRGDEREEDREDKTTEERTEKIHFQCGGAWPFFVDVVIFWLIPLRTKLVLAKQCQVRFILDFSRLTVFIICELIFLCSYSFHFFAYAVTVSNFSELFFYAATVFFLPELILHKFSV